MSRARGAGRAALEVHYEVGGETRVLPLDEKPLRIGRGHDNEVRLPDYSVSRRHAVLRPRGDGWVIEDLASTNGIQVAGETVSTAALEAGLTITVGVFELQVAVVNRDGERDGDGDTGTVPVTPVAGPPSQPATVSDEVSTVGETGATDAIDGDGDGDGDGEEYDEPSTARDLALANATIVRSLSAFTADYGLEEDGQSEVSSASRKRQALDEAYASQVFGFLTRLARLLITAESVDEVLERVTEIAFEALPVDRGFILLRPEDGAPLLCALMRIGETVTLRPQEDVPVSTTMLEAVMRERVALLTYDALTDERLSTQESIRMHQIRAAMCAPLWSGERIIGVMQVDSPRTTGTFTEQDVDLFTALANYCAVAVERLENARRVEAERRARERLARYHSPAVIESVLREGADAGDGPRDARPAVVSVLFADFVGFTSFAEQALPEQVAAVMRTFFSHAVEAIFEAGGTLDKFIGDCVMAFFGAPMAQEDHARRAVSAAIAIQHALGAWNRDLERRGLPAVAARIGVNSGPVVVGDIGSDRRVDYTVLGNTVNVAARLEEAVARPGEVVIGDETCRLVAGAFPTVSLGSVQLKGLRRGIEAHRVELT